MRVEPRILPASYAFYGHKGRFLFGGEIWVPILDFGNTVLISKVGHPEVIIAHLYFSLSCLAV